MKNIFYRRTLSLVLAVMIMILSCLPSLLVFAESEEEMTKEMQMTRASTVGGYTEGVKDGELYRLTTDTLYEIIKDSLKTDAGNWNYNMPEETDKYRWESASGRWDCSSFIMYLYKFYFATGKYNICNEDGSAIKTKPDYGVSSINNTLKQLQQLGSKISKASVEKIKDNAPTGLVSGDLLFYGEVNSSGKYIVTHVAMYLGEYKGVGNGYYQIENLPSTARSAIGVKKSDIIAGNYNGVAISPLRIKGAKEVTENLLWVKKLTVRSYATITLNKESEEGNIPLSGATFTAYVYDYDTGKYNTSNPIAFTDNHDGTYITKKKIDLDQDRIDEKKQKIKIVEEEAPDGYSNLDAQGKMLSWIVNVITGKSEALGNTSELYSFEKTIVNTPIRSEAGSLKIVKTDSDTNKRLSEASFNLYSVDESGKEAIVKPYEEYGINYVQGDIDANGLVVTNEDGIAEVTNLPIGNYLLKEISAPEGYVLKTTKISVTIAKGKTKTVTVSNTPQTAKIKVEKLDIITGKPVAGAKFRLYAADNAQKKQYTLLTDEVYQTDTDGYLVFDLKKVDADEGAYKLVEFSPLTGYENDKISVWFNVSNNQMKITNYSQAVFTIVNNGKTYTNKLNTTISATDSNPATIYIPNTPIKTKIRIVKTDAYTNALLNQKNKGEKIDKDKIITPDMVVAETVLKEGSGYRIYASSISDKIINNLIDYGWKIDKDAYLTYEDSADKLTYGTKEHPFTTTFSRNEEGKITDAYIELAKELPCGAYQLEEVQAPNGYVLQGNEQVATNIYDETYRINGYTLTDVPTTIGSFIISQETVFPMGETGNDKNFLLDKNNNYVITVLQENEEQRGIVSVIKQGEKLVGVTKADEQYQFDYALAPVEGAKFEVIADEDIYYQQIDTKILDQYVVNTDKYLLFKKGELITTLTTDRNGYACFAGLYLGKYKIGEIIAGDGFVLNKEETVFEITSANQNFAFVPETKNKYINERQTLALEVAKTDIDTKKGVEGTIFGLYANEDIYTYLSYGGTKYSIHSFSSKVGEYQVDANEVSDEYLIEDKGNCLIKKGELLATISTDKEGKACFYPNGSLPLGSYTIKELQASSGYTLETQPDKSEVTIDGSYLTNGGQDIPKAFYGVSYENQKTKFVINKQDIVSSTNIEGATLSVYKVKKDNETGDCLIQSDGNYALEEKPVDTWISKASGEDLHYFYEKEDYIYDLEKFSDLPEGETLIIKDGHLIEGLEVGSYYVLREVQAPENYVGYQASFEETKRANAIENSLTSEVCFYVKNTNEIISHTLSDQRTVGHLAVDKTGEFVTGYEGTSWIDELKNYFYSIFKWEWLKMEGVAFEVYAACDIYTPDQAVDEEGNRILATYSSIDEKGNSEIIELKKGNKIATIITDISGVASLTNLPLGTYEVREVNVGESNEFVLNEETNLISLTWKTQDEAVVEADVVKVKNLRQKVEINLTKKTSAKEMNKYLAKDEQLKEDLTIEGAVYGLYAREDIIGYKKDDETDSVISTETILISNGTLLETQKSDKEGRIHFITDLPLGQYEVKEITPAVGYGLSSECMAVDASYQGADIKVITIEKDVYDIPNLAAVSKVDITNSKEIKGAKLELSDENGKIVDHWTSDKNIHYIWGLAEGKTYTLTERCAPKNYALAESITFTVKSAPNDGTKLTIVPQNIEMKDTPLEKENTKTTITVDTGDRNGLNLWMILFFSAIGLFVGGIVKKKRTTMDK